MSAELEERFRMAILNFSAGKSFAERMRTIAAILAAFGDLEAAGDNPRGARLLFDAAAQLEHLAEAAE
ncbi:MAG TPA: hypothetical protein VEW06_06240 [Xanthobacteraceae bacterium]|nr:hypothetical protein [Xanthobacteraceae bacterium]